MVKKIAIVGFGSRGAGFAKHIRNHKNAELVAVADITESRLIKAQTEYGIDKSMCFKSADEFFAQGKICDAIVLSTQDAQHHEMAIKALNLGYDICLEKPAAATIEECIDIRDTANRLGRKVMIAHVLRYAPFYGYIKKLISEGTIGEVVTIGQTENVAHWHFALSYVRGPWRNMKESTPTIIAKCCHDLDIIKWLMDKKCTAISSFGNLFFFNPAHAPEGSAEFCADCSPEVREKCLYNAYNIYPERINSSVFVGGIARLKGLDINKVIDEKEDIISRCVFHAGNDAVDNQVVNMNFEDGSTAQLTMIAYSKECHRTIAIHGTKGEIYGDVDKAKVHVNMFNGECKVVDIKKEFYDENNKLNDGHGGGDAYLTYDFIDYITYNTPSITRTTIDDSIESHIMGFKAEESRQNNGKVMEL